MMDDPLFEIPVVLKVKGTKGDKGDKGDAGIAGKDGRDGYNGRDGKDGSDGINGISGKDGRNGKDGLSGKSGVDGKSAYQLWLSLGNRGSVEDFILCLRGKDGLSAYDIWLNNNYNGTEEDFLLWLKGKDGITYQNIGMSVPDLAGMVGRLKTKESTLSTDDVMIQRAGSLFRINHSDLLLDYVPYIGAAQDVDINSQNLITTGQIINRNVQASLSSGVHDGCNVIINTDPTKIDISSGNYTIVDSWTDAENPVTYDVTFAGLTGIDVTYLASADFSYIALDNTGSVYQMSAPPTSLERRDYVVLCQLGHTSRTSVASVNNTTQVFQSPMSQARDMMAFIGLVNSGNRISANGANLSINKAEGQLLQEGVNFYNNNKQPNVIDIPAEVPLTFRRRTQTGEGANNAITLDVANYDLNGTLTPIVGNKATNQRVFLFPNGNVVVQYGQKVYANLAAAVADKENQDFVPVSNVVGNAAYIGVISVVSNATDLSDTSQAIFSTTSKFGEVATGSAGTSTTTQQQAYANSLSNPEIEITPIGGAMTYRAYLGGDALDVIEVQNNAGSVTFGVTGNGYIVATRLTVNSTTNGILFPRMTTTQKNAIISPTGGLVIYDTTLNKLCVYTTAWETITST